MNFSYIAYAADRGIIKDQIQARNEYEARTEITRQGLRILKLQPAKPFPGLEELFPSLYSVSSGELVRFSRQMATMLGSGSNLLRVLEMLQRETPNKVLRRALTSIYRKLDEGDSLSAALAEHPKVFSRLFISVVEVGEHTGRLTAALEQLADILEKEHEAKQKAIRTLMYPMAIIGLSLLTMGVLMTVALPPLLKVFEQSGADIPLMTRIVVKLVGLIRENYRNIMVGFLVMVALGWTGRRVPAVRYWMDVAQVKAPIAGGIVLAAELSRFARTITMLLEAGVTLAGAMQLALSGCKNQLLHRAFSEAEESLLGGHGLTRALRRYPIIPSMFLELVMLGEESNSLKRTMNEAAIAYQKQLERKLDGLLGMLEPLSTVVVGGIVGFIAFSMFIPIYSGLNAAR